MSEQFKQVGWDEEDSGGGGPYLYLKHKDEKARIRFVGKPISFEEKDVEGKTKTRFAAIVLYRNPETKLSEVRGFKFGASIYKELRKYYNDPEYGDPTAYDVTVTRHEVKPTFYSVVASPKRSEITQAEKDAVLAASLDLHKMYARQTDVQGTGPSDPAATDDEYDPFENE